MSAISIETKKVTELTAFTTPTDSCLIPIHDGTGLKKITFANFRAKAVKDTEAKIAPLLFNNAGAHNAIYRGKSLGSTVTTAQYSAINAGTFDDLYIGDYWTIGLRRSITTSTVVIRTVLPTMWLSCRTLACITHKCTTPAPAVGKTVRKILRLTAMSARICTRAISNRLRPLSRVRSAVMF